MTSLETPQIDLQAVAKRVMLENGFEPEFSPAIQQQLAELRAHPPQLAPGASVRDARNLLWTSIDNDTSRDLDQIEVAERLSNGDIKVLIGIADVDAFVSKGSPIDQYAAREATTVYTGVRNFSMLPEQLSTGASSLLEADDKLAIIIEFVVGKDGEVRSSDVYRATVRNKAQLIYNSVGAWLEGMGTPPEKIAASKPLQNQLWLQDEAARALRLTRYRRGALNIETIETRPLMKGDMIAGIVGPEKNRATELIEDFMIAANAAIARMLEAKKVSSLRRVVKVPARWSRIVELAAKQGSSLPAEPDSKALNEFLVARKAADPDHFADLCLAVVKLMGPGE
jgi:exoribonuclease-2